MSIISVKARQVLDSRGNPTVECEVKTKSGIYSAMVPSGASTGKHEAIELRDGNQSYFNGKGVLKAVENINKIIAPKITGMDPTQQNEIDNVMIELDGTENKSNLGANAILAVSIAACKAGAGEKNIPLYQHIGELCKNTRFVLPVPMVLVIEGGKHADQSSDIQEFMIMPYNNESFKESIRMGAEIYHAIGKILKGHGFNINVGYEGAYGPNIGSNEKVFEMIVEGIKKAGYTPLEDVVIAIDSAASEFFENGKYNLKVDGRELNSEEMIKFYEEIVNKYPVISIEDGFAEDDWEGWTMMNAKLGDKIQIIGDDLTVTNISRIQKAIDTKAINAVLIKLNQIGTVTETINAIKLAKENNFNSIISHRSAETEDTFIADFVVGAGTGQCKFGATARGERTCKYNRLMKIEDILGEKSVFAGKNFRAIK